METQPSRFNDVLHWIWDNFEKLFVTGIFLANLVLAWRILPVLGMPADVLNDYSLFILLLALVGLSIVERELLNAWFGWYKPSQRGRGLTGYPFLIAVWIGLLVLTGWMATNERYYRRAAAEQQKATQKEREMLNSPEVKDAIKGH